MLGSLSEPDTAKQKWLPNGLKADEDEPAIWRTRELAARRA
ncbi:MAG: hypothetical protein ACTMKY_02275 [Dermabacteraceae bacterium]